VRVTAAVMTEAKKLRSAPKARAKVSPRRCQAMRKTRVRARVVRMRARRAPRKRSRSWVMKSRASIRLGVMMGAARGVYGAR
jgi:hypothetical protein